MSSVPRPVATRRRLPFAEALNRPGVIAVLATAVGWVGVFIALAGSRIGVEIAAIATALGLILLLRGRRRERESYRQLQEALAAHALRNRQLMVLRELAGTMLRVDTLAELFHEVVGVARSLFEAETAGIMLVTEEGRFLRLAAGVGEFAAHVDKLVPSDRSLSGWVVARDEGLIVNDLGRGDLNFRVEGLRVEGRRTLAAPLRSSGLVLGTLVVMDRNHGTGYATADLELLQTLADQVAVGIDRTRALQENQLNVVALAAKNAELLRATHLKNAFLANMSHELRTPLNAIIGFSDLLIAGGGGPLGSQQRDFLESISRNGHHLLDLINNVLDLSKIEAGRMTVTLAPTDLRQAIVAATRDTASLRGTKRQACDVQLEDDPLTVVCDGQRIRQVLYNLLANASKFTPDEGHITLSAIRTRAPLPIPAQRVEDGPGMVTRDAVWVAVSDDGIGIHTEDLPRLFVEFSQVDGSMGRRAQGTGLGLALCRKFVEMMGGTIGCESILGKGSTFWFILPVEGPIRRPEGATTSEEAVVIEAPLERRAQGS